MQPKIALMVEEWTLILVLYQCLVFPSCLVDGERDYLSLNKRYPKLSISPDFSKVVLNWPREMENLKLSFHTPVSFEHDLVEVDSYPEQKKASSQSVNEQYGTSKCGATVWNAKVILMSGISRDALEELSSDKSYDDRIPHINNILRFAFLRENRAFMAIGGPQDVVEDASVDDSSLIKTALSYTKDLTQLDLQKCQNWNRFLEIHYDRVGKDGLYSHKEITVLYVPDLSECLPSLNAWRDQWIAHKKSLAERERRIAVEREKKSSEKDVVKGERSQTKSGKDTDSPKKVKTEGSVSKLGKEEKKEARGPSSEQAIDGKKLEKDGTNVEEKAGDEMKGVTKDKKVENTNEGEGEEDRKNAETKESEETSTAAKTGVQKPGKKRIVKKVVKQKVAEKKAVPEGEKSGGEKEGKSESTPQQDESSVDPAGVRTFTRKKIVKKVPAGKVSLKENKSVDLDATQTESKSEKGVECQEDKPKDTIDPNSDSVQAVSVKTSGKKKIIKRVPKRKVTELDDKGGESANNTKDGNTDEKVTQKVTDAENSKEQTAGEDKPVVEAKKPGKKTSPKTVGKTIVAEKQEDVVNTIEKEIKDEKVDEKVDKKEIPGGDEKGTKKETKVPKEKSSTKDSHDGKSGRLRDDKEKKDKTAKDESRHKSSKEVKEREKPEEPPKQPGLILQTKGSKESKIRSMSLSLDALLDYNDKDIEESTFELSLFAESLYEMLQYQMGCRLLTFLQKLRIIFLKKRNQRKRERDEKLEKESDIEKSSRKRSKTTETSSVVNESAKYSVQNVANPDNEDAVTKDESAVSVKKEDASADEDNDSKMDNEEADDYDPEEDVEEDPEEDDDDDDDEDAEEDQEMEASSPQNDTSKEAGNEVVMTDAEAIPEKEVGDKMDETKESAEGDKSVYKSTERGDNSSAKKSKGKEVEGETEKKAKPVKQEAVVDKELLQAFRFFDRNRVGYVKVEDLRLIIHNLGKFLPHRVVKELVQSALLESNTARDNRILYNKLVRMANI